MATWRPPSSSRTWSPFASRTATEMSSVSLTLEGQARDVEAPVAVGREDAAHADLPQDGRRVLESLRDEEGAEGGDHEDGEDARPQATQSVTSDALAISRAPAASSPRATASASRMTPRWQTTSAGSSDGPRAQIGQPRLHARGLLGERLAARVAERRVRALEAREAVGILGADVGERAVRPVAGVGLGEARVLDGLAGRSARPRRRPSRARAAAGCTTARRSPPPRRPRPAPRPARARWRRAGRLGGPGSGPRGCRPSARGGPGGWSCAGGGTTAPCRPRRRRRPPRGRRARARWRPSA